VLGKNNHINALDGLRAIAILIVLVSHGGFGHIVPGGFGVTLFFFLSGFLITTLLRREHQKSGEINLKGFYFRRAVRILPPFFIAIAFACLLAGFGLQPERIVPKNLIWDFLFLTNYTPYFGVRSGVNIPLWSLDVEEYFYILFPSLFILLSRKIRTSPIAVVCAGICLAVLMIRLLNTVVLENYAHNYNWTHTRIDSILFGCCLALWNNPAEGAKDFFRSKWVSVTLAAVLLASAFVIRDPYFRETFRYTIQGVGLFFLFNFLIREKGLISRWLAMKPLKVVALLSYTLYLVHWPIFLALKITLPNLHVVLHLLVGSGLSFVLAGAVYLLVERPLLIWRKKVESGKKTKPVHAPVRPRPILQKEMPAKTGTSLARR